MAIDWEPLRSIIAANQRFVLTSHVRPDADALGSELGMAGLLEHLGKDVRIVNASPVPHRLAFLDPDKKVMTPLQRPFKLIEDGTPIKELFA